MLKFNKKLGILVTAITVSLLSTSIVSAKASAIVITGKDGKSYEYNYTDLKSSATADALGDTVNGALYENFIQNKASIAAYYDDVRNVYISSSVVNQEAISKVMEGKNFDFAVFLENTNTASTNVTSTKVTKDNLINTGNTNNDSNIVTFKDLTLEKAVRDSINKPTGDIYKSDVAKITKLTIAGPILSIGNLKDISGIENLTNLQYLDLSFNPISDISGLKGLSNLQYLDLSSNEISDISALKGLTNLQILYLSDNQINNISILAGLTNLQQLSLSCNPIKNISMLKGLTNLQKLYLYMSGISDISPLAGLTNLQDLDLYENNISDISPLKGLTNLKNLVLFDNRGISNDDINSLKEALPNCCIHSGNQ